MKRCLLFSGCLLLAGAVCVAVSLQNIGVPAFEKPNLSDIKPSPVIKTISSDTVVVLQDGNEAIIWLAGVEKPTSGVDLAEKFVGNLLKGENVFVLPDPLQKQADPNSCMAAYIYRAPDGLFVNAEIIRQGYGLASMKSLFRYMNEFRHLELFAKQAGKGVWASSEPIPPEKQNEPNKPVAQSPPVVAPANDTSKTPGNDNVIVYVTKSGTKYHKLGCRFLSKSSRPMKLKDAKIRYSPCSVCNPP